MNSETLVISCMAMGAGPHLPATLLLIVASFFLAGCATADEELYTPLRSQIFCPAEGGTITAGSMFQANREGLLHSLSAGAATNAGFLNTTFGDPNDQAFGVIMCFADTTWADCTKCLRRAPSYLMSTACPGGRTGALVYEECLLRYSDENFASTHTYDRGDPWHSSYGVYVDDVVSMNITRWKMMNRLIAEAAAAPLRYALDNNETYKDPTTGVGVYGLLQCRTDLTTEWCKICLSVLVRILLRDFPNNTGASLKGLNCYVKYHFEPIQLMMVPPHEAPPPPDPTSTKDPKAKKSLILAASASGIFFLSTLAIMLRLVFGSMWKWRGRFAIASAADEDMERKFRNGAGPKGFSYGVLAAATSKFSDDQKLGEGGFGSVYKGFLDQQNLHVAIKRVSRSSSQGRKEYASEVTIISQLRHRNLVKLIGWCHGHEELLLVYDLMPNGSLDRHLYSTDNILSWQHRYDIILGIGSALLYLHQDCEQGVLHRDIKPSNVMLDASFNAKLGDFGLARLVDHGRGAHTTELAGTMGYMDPDCIITGRFSTESDMYSFGVVLLEVACGRRPVVPAPQKESAVVHLARRVLEMHGRGEVLDAADPRLGGDFDARQMERVLEVGLWCTAHDRSLRPSIWQAVRALRFESSVPIVTNGHGQPPVALLASVPSSFVLEDEDKATSSMHVH